MKIPEIFPNYELTNTDLNELNTICNITESIYENYKKLMTTDNLEERQVILNAMKSTINLENNLYENLDADESKLVALMKFIENKIGDYNNFQFKMALVMHDDADATLILTRIVEKLRFKIIEYLNKNNTYGAIIGVPKIEIDKDTQIVDYISLLSTAETIKMDLINILVNMILKEKDNYSKDISAYLKTRLYKISFIYDFIEDRLVNNNLEHNEMNYIYYENIKNTYQLSDKLILNLKNTYIAQLIIPFNKINKIPNNELNNPNKELEFILLLIRSGLSFDWEKSFTQTFIDTLNKEKAYRIIMKTENDKILEYIYSSCEKISEDRKEIKVLSLK